MTKNQQWITYFKSFEKVRDQWAVLEVLEVLESMANLANQPISEKMPKLHFLTHAWNLIFGGQMTSFEMIKNSP